jgi:hypothetical protein
MLVFDWPEEERKGAAFMVDEAVVPVKSRGAIEYRCAPGLHHVGAWRPDRKLFTAVVEVKKRHQIRPAWEDVGGALILESRCDEALSTPADLALFKDWPVAFPSSVGLAIDARCATFEERAKSESSLGECFGTAYGPPIDLRKIYGAKPDVAKSGKPYAGRRGMSELGLCCGNTKTTERSVAGALNWLARHQNADGSWSTSGFPKRCRDGDCGGAGQIETVYGGTALGLLPFLAAGQTHRAKGIYQPQVTKAVNWLIKNQKSGGELFGGSYAMYEHGLATIALCEAYAMTRDSAVRAAAQNAVAFIARAQNRAGSWRYLPGSDDCDTSVFGWQMRAFKSGITAGLEVDRKSMERGYNWLMNQAHAGARDSSKLGQFAYRVHGNEVTPPTPSMTALGLLIMQQMDAGQDDPIMASGVRYLMANAPDNQHRNTYYWYYATQVMHNMGGRDWDVWNRRMRRVLVESQIKTGCASGSWDPERPEADAWGKHGGRLFVTSLSCLILEVYYPRVANSPAE